MSPTFDRRQFLYLASAGALIGDTPTASQMPSVTRRDAPTLSVFHDRATLRHEPSSSHPERPPRMDAALAAVRSVEALVPLMRGMPRAASDEDLLRVHTSQYLALVKAEVARGRPTLSTGDTEISAGSLVAARAGAGCVLSAVDAVMKGPTRRAFCAIRPPGHHASAGRGMGFCLFNNLAVGVRYAQAAFGVQRTLVVDWDVHHGNGTQDVFWNDGSVLFFDTHQHPWYPGSGLSSEAGEGKARGLIINRPLSAGAGRAQVLEAFLEHLVPAARRFKPDLVMISAGFDSRRGDPLGRFTLDDADFAELTALVCDIADDLAGGRVVSVLEGGYALDGLERAVNAHVLKLTEGPKAVSP